MLLTIAIIPIGMISISQATRALKETRQLASSALIGEVTRAALDEIDIFSDALATARALGHQVLDRDEQLLPNCVAQLKSFVENYDLYLFAGFITPDGIMSCSSTGDTADYSKEASFELLKANATESIRVVSSGQFTKQNVIIASQPIVRKGLLVGFVSVSIPIEVMRIAARSGNEAEKFHIALVDREGRVFASNSPASQTVSWLPTDVNLRSLEVQRDTIFEAESMAGETRTYALTPIFKRQVFALAANVTNDPFATSGRRYLSAYVFPMAMWAIGLMVSLLAVHRLIIRHITSLRNKMRAFESGERNITDLALSNSPGELAELGESFSRMIATISQDEVIQSAALREKNVLLREVYHRVKNNLQLILSIISMQSRNAITPEAKSELTRLQNRVMSIATIHQLLYTVPELRAARADGLLDEIARNLVAAGTTNEDVTLDIAIESVKLTPDQAVPLSLYLSEAITNALKHALAGRENGRIAVSLKRDGAAAVLRIGNTIAPLPEGFDAPASGGLGSRLMSAFTHQLNGEEERTGSDDEYMVSLTFPLETNIQNETE